MRNITGYNMPITLQKDCASLYDHVYLHKAVCDKRLLIEPALICDAITKGESKKKCFSNALRHTLVVLGMH